MLALHNVPACRSAVQLCGANSELCPFGYKEVHPNSLLILRISFAVRVWVLEKLLKWDVTEWITSVTVAVSIYPKHVTNFLLIICCLAQHTPHTTLSSDLCVRFRNLPQEPSDLLQKNRNLLLTQKQWCSASLCVWMMERWRQTCMCSDRRQRPSSVSLLRAFIEVRPFRRTFSDGWSCIVPWACLLHPSTQRYPLTAQEVVQSSQRAHCALCTPCTPSIRSDCSPTSPARWDRLAGLSNWP